MGYSCTRDAANIWRIQSMKRTNKYRIETYDQVEAERDLLSLYLYDTATSIGRSANPPITEHIRDKHASVTGSLYRPLGALGGYVVLRVDDNVSIHAFETLYEWYRTQCSEHTLAIRTVMERLNVTRNRMFDEAQAVSTGGIGEDDMERARR